MNSVLSLGIFYSALRRGTAFLVFYGFGRGIVTALLYHLPLILSFFFFLLFYWHFRLCILLGFFFFAFFLFPCIFASSTGFSVAWAIFLSTS